MNMQRRKKTMSEYKRRVEDHLDVNNSHTGATVIGAHVAMQCIRNKMLSLSILRSSLAIHLPQNKCHSIECPSHKVKQNDEKTTAGIINAFFPSIPVNFEGKFK